MKTLQEVYSISRNHLLAQNRRCGSYACYYRGDIEAGFGGFMCAIGVLIDDKHYHYGLENLEAGDKIVIDAVTASGNWSDDPRTTACLTKLQEVHDLDPVDNWYDLLPESVEEFLK